MCRSVGHRVRGDVRYPVSNNFGHGVSADLYGLPRKEGSSSSNEQLAAADDNRFHQEDIGKGQRAPQRAADVVSVLKAVDRFAARSPNRAQAFPEPGLANAT